MTLEPRTVERAATFDPFRLGHGAGHKIGPPHREQARVLSERVYQIVYQMNPRKSGILPYW